MKTIKYFLVMTYSFLFLSLYAQAKSLEENVNQYTNLFGSYPSSTTIMQNSPLNRGGEMRPKTILKGVFYFGGSDIKRGLLSKNTQDFLCTSGFSATYSVYDSPKNSSFACKGNSMSYSKTGEASKSDNGGYRVRQLLENLYNIIQSNDNKGPVYLHCWYGVHASNTIAQIVLKQFCGWSTDELIHNWDNIDIYNSLGEKGRKENLEKISIFQPYEDLHISTSAQSLICP
ncbi:MAG: hypothetical protein KDD34_08240 [Bdellovibrionales bacterium]|nr:hypothetical protein [Bdellovibrionales bacterium]